MLLLWHSYLAIDNYFPQWDASKEQLKLTTFKKFMNSL